MRMQQTFPIAPDHPIDRTVGHHINVRPDGCRHHPGDSLARNHSRRSAGSGSIRQARRAASPRGQAAAPIRLRTPAMAVTRSCAAMPISVPVRASRFGAMPRASMTRRRPAAAHARRLRSSTLGRDIERATGGATCALVGRHRRGRAAERGEQSEVGTPIPHASGSPPDLLRLGVLT